MSHRRSGMNPFQAVIRQRQIAEKGRGDGHGVGSGANVVKKSGQGELGRASATADFVFGFEHHHGTAGAGDGDRCGKTVRSRTNYYRVVFGSSRRHVTSRDTPVRGKGPSGTHSDLHGLG